MRTIADLPFRTCARLPVLLVALVGLAPIAHAQSTVPPALAAGALNAAVITPGATAVSGLSGTVLAGESLSPGVHPINKTVIDVAGASLRIFDLAAIGAPPAGQVVIPSVKLELKAKDIGQVFALAFDEGSAGAPPNLYALATSAFGIHIVAERPDADGKPVRLRAGAPGARFMEGQFGGVAGSGPGTIWKIDGTTGAVSVFANTAANGLANSGPGLGDIAYDPKSRSLYVSDLDTGLIHRFTLDGRAGAPFDHGVAGRRARRLPAIADDDRRMDITKPAFKPDDPATWGFTQRERRVDGLAVHDGRLYYAVAAGPEIWSVRVNADGSFGADPRLETEVRSALGATVTDILFDAQGRMTLALRGAVKGSYDFRRFVEPGTGPVLRYLPKQPGDRATAGAWQPEPALYPVGTGDAGRGGSGGIALGHGYRADGVVDPAACSATLMVTGDTLLAPAPGAAVHGVQLGAIDLVPGQFAFADFDGGYDDPDTRGRVGDVEVFQRCDRAAASPRVADGGSASPRPAGGASPARSPSPGGAPAGSAPGGGGASPGGSNASPGAGGSAPGGANAADQQAAACGAKVSGRSGPNCQLRPDGSKSCVWNLLLENLGNSPNVAFTATTSQPSSETQTIGATKIFDSKVTSPTTTRFSSDVGAGAITSPNIGGVFPPGPVDPTLTVAPGDAASEACVPPASSAAAPPPPGAPKLRGEKMAKGCRKVGEYATCGFDIVVTNDGPTAFNDPIVLNDETNFATLATSGSVGFSCDNLQGGATRSHRCGIAAPNIAPHASITVNLESQVWLRTVPVDTPPGGCKLDNTVTIAAPASEGPPPTAKASAPFPVEPNQGRAIPCDPPSLKLAKTAQGCSVSASGFECRYKLTVTSTGPDPYQDAPIEISEPLPTGASVTAHSRGWVCSGSGPATQCRTAGDGPNGSGTDGRVTLAVGATVDLDLVVAVPKSAAGRSGCEVSNSAQIVQQGRGLTGAGEQFGAAATAKVDSPECRPSALSCPANYTGVYPTCCRPPAQQYDAAQRACVAATPAALPTIAECYRGMVLVSNR